MTLDIPVPVEADERSGLERETDLVGLPVIIPEALPVAPILSRSFGDLRDDHESSISLDNSLVFDNDEEDDVSTVVLDANESKDGRDSGQSQQEKHDMEVIRADLNYGIREHSDTTKDSPTLQLIGKGRGRGFWSEMAASSGPLVRTTTPSPSLSAKLAVIVPNDTSSQPLVSGQVGVGGNKKSATMGSFREEVAKVTSRTRTEQEKRFLEDVLGGEESSSSSLSDSDWKDNKLLPRP